MIVGYGAKCAKIHQSARDEINEGILTKVELDVFVFLNSRTFL